MLLLMQSAELIRRRVSLDRFWRTAPLHHSSHDAAAHMLPLGPEARCASNQAPTWCHLPWRKARGKGASRHASIHLLRQVQESEERIQGHLQATPSTPRF